MRISLYLNMFGYDDELNQIVMKKALDPSVTVLSEIEALAGIRRAAAIILAKGKAKSKPGGVKDNAH